MHGYNSQLMSYVRISQQAMLMALYNADRSSDLIALDPNFRQYTSGEVKFTIPGLTKTRQSGQSIQSKYYIFHITPSFVQLPPYNIMNRLKSITLDQYYCLSGYLPEILHFFLVIVTFPFAEFPSNLLHAVASYTAEFPIGFSGITHMANDLLDFLWYFQAW